MSDQLQPDDTLDDRGLDDVLDEGYSPPERASATLRHEIAEGDDLTLDEQLAEEEPDSNATLVHDDDSPRDPDDWSGDWSGDDWAEEEIGDQRSGRLVDPGAGAGEDTESELIAEDVGIDGAGASAEEAAVHTIDDEA